MSARIRLGIATLVLTAIPAAAASLLTPDQVDASKLLPIPPAADSHRAADEIAELKYDMANRTPAEKDAAAADAKDETGGFYASAIGTGFDLSKLPATKALLTDIGDTEELLAGPAKKFFHRDRPWIVMPGLPVCTPVKDGPAANSYPSGHSTRGYAMAVVLAQLMPEKAQAILARASLYAEHRIVCGAHYRSDIVAGEAFGTAIALTLKQSPVYQKEFDAAAAELSAAHLRAN